MKRKIILVCLTLIFSGCQKTNYLAENLNSNEPPKNIYETIDTRNTLIAISTFQGDSMQGKFHLAEKIENNLSKYAPSALFSLSSYYLKQNDIDRAAHIFLLAELRAIIDGNMAYKDKSAFIAAVDSLNKPFFTELNKDQKQASKFKGKLTGIVDETIKLDKSIPRAYDRRWPYLGGEKAFITNNPEAIEIAKGEHAKNLIQESYKYIRGFVKEINNYNY